MEEIHKILQENALLKEQLSSHERQLLDNNEQLSLLKEQLLLKEDQLLLKDEQLLLKEEQLARKNERILYLERQLYGRRSEKQLPPIDEAQLSLFDFNQGDVVLEEEKTILTTVIEDIEQKAAIRRNKKKQNAAPQKRSYKLPADLERRETILLPESIDVSEMVKIGEDVSERLMLEPSKFWVERIVRPLYKNKEENTSNSTTTTIHQATKPAIILPGCFAGESLLAQIVIDKFLYHLPEYRQHKRFSALGVDISTSSINRWVHDLADKLYPLYIALMKRVLASDYIQVDETTHKITDRRGTARKAYIWAVRDARSPGIFFHYDKGSRSQEVVLKLLKDYQGALQTDGYAAYSIYENKQGVLPLGCMAHVRRKFETALQTTPEAQRALDYIALLYTLEANLKDEDAGNAEKHKRREEQAYPILQAMERWMKQQYNECTPKSALGKAISYAFGMWPRISRYCSQGYFDIDNNAIERAIRPIAIGRKNYLFSGNDSGAEDNCIYYSLLGTCIEAGVDPHE
ncbi:IS66-like element ISBf10 family transposase [Paludibacter sp.]